MRNYGLCFVLALFCVCVSGVFAQVEGQSVYLDSEVRSINTILADAKTTEKDRHDAFVRLARIQVLTGDIEGAAVTWEQAAYAEAGKRDDTALLENAACLMAMGEWEKADANVHIVLLTVRDDRKTYIKAKYLSAQIEAFRSGSPVILTNYLDESEFAQERAAIYYTLWKTTGNEEYRTRLLIEHAESPETKALLVEAGAVTGVTIFPGAMWLLPGINPESIATRTIQSPEPVMETATPPSLQTGLFADRDNALVQQSKLLEEGFNATVSLRRSSGRDFWLVSVPAGSDLNQTMILLQSAGYEALPVF